MSLVNLAASGSTVLGGKTRRWPERQRLIQWLVTLAAVLLAAVLSFARLPRPAQGSLWAEDGGIFLRDALNGGGPLEVFAPYEGYLHVIPRLAASTVVALVPVDYFALALNFLSCLIVSLVAFMVFQLSKQFSSNTLIRLCWASVSILVAPGPLETLGNFANVHWYLLWLTPWLLLKPAKSRAEGVLLFLASLLVSLTEIISLMFIPLFLYRVRDKAGWAARAGLLLGLICQVTTVLSFPRSPSSGYPVNFLSVLEGWFLNTSSALVYGDSASIIHHVQTFGALPIVLAALPFLLMFLYVLKRGTPEHRLLAAVLLAASLGTWVATQVANPQRFFDYSQFSGAEWETFFLSRYSTAPSMFLLALVPLAAAVALGSSRATYGAILGGFVVLQLLFFFPSGVARADGPVWKEGTAAAREACYADPGLNTVPVPIAPRGWFADKVEISCHALLAGAK